MLSEDGIGIKYQPADGSEIQDHWSADVNEIQSIDQMGVEIKNYQ